MTGRVRTIGLALALLLVGCGRTTDDEPRVAVPGGDAARGRHAIAEYGCGACHVIPGIKGADGLVGPPLERWSRRSFIAGAVPNTPDQLVRWIQAPQAVEPGTAMPDLGVTERESRDIAAYLSSLR